MQNTRGSITGSALQLCYCKAHAKTNRKVENLTCCKIVTLENFTSKLCTGDYVGDDKNHANFDGNQFCGGFSLVGEI